MGSILRGNFGQFPYWPGCGSCTVFVGLPFLPSPSTANRTQKVGQVTLWNIQKDVVKHNQLYGACCIRSRWAASHFYWTSHHVSSLNGSRGECKGTVFRDRAKLLSVWNSMVNTSIKSAGRYPEPQLVHQNPASRRTKHTPPWILVLGGSITLSRIDKTFHHSWVMFIYLPQPLYASADGWVANIPSREHNGWAGSRSNAIFEVTHLSIKVNYPLLFFDLCLTTVPIQCRHATGMKTVKPLEKRELICFAMQIALFI